MSHSLEAPARNSFHVLFLSAQNSNKSARAAGKEAINVKQSKKSFYSDYDKGGGVRLEHSHLVSKSIRFGL